jgi:hypothetical protein
MVNDSNIKPAERVDMMIEIANKFGTNAVMHYLLNELANCSHFKRFDDECYWKDVYQEFNSRMLYEG